MATDRPSSWSNSMKARRSCSAHTLSTAFRRSGRVIVTMVTGPSCVTDRASVR
jgi:hypothetical protein